MDIVTFTFKEWMVETLLRKLQSWYIGQVMWNIDKKIQLWRFKNEK